MDPIEAKKRKMEERAASRRAKLSDSAPITESSETTTPEAQAAPSDAGTPAPSAPSGATPAQSTPATPTPAASGKSEPATDEGGPSNQTLAIIAVVLLVIVIGIVATRGDDSNDPPVDPVAGGDVDPPEDPPADPPPADPPVDPPPADPPADPPPADPPADPPPADPPVDPPVDPPPADPPVDPPPADPPVDPPPADPPADPPPADPPPVMSGIEIATRALKAAAADDPNLEALRTALRQEIAQIEIQGRALTSVEQLQIQAARRALESSASDPDVGQRPAVRGPVHNPPTDLTATSDAPKSIRLTWKRADAIRLCVITGYSVERKARGQIDWAEIGSIPEGAPTEYVDRDVDDGVLYRYRITASAEIDKDDPVVIKQSLVLPPGQHRRSSEEIGPLRAIRGVHFVPTTVEPGISAYVLVYTWDKEESQFVSKGFQVKIGEKIGAVVRKKGRELDFSTNATLLSAETGKRKHPTKDYMQSYTAIKVKLLDGTEQEITDRDLPDAVKKKE